MKRLFAKLLDWLARNAFPDPEDLVSQVQENRVIGRTVACAICNGDTRTPSTSAWMYNTSDPLAVTLFAGTNRVEWVFGRDLLRDGALTGAGDGDVVISPVKHGVQIVLRNTTGRVTLLFANDDLIDFLESTERLVPWGEEQVDQDALVKAVTA